MSAFRIGTLATIAAAVAAATPLGVAVGVTAVVAMEIFGRMPEILSSCRRSQFQATAAAAQAVNPPPAQAVNPPLTILQEQLINELGAYFYHLEQKGVDTTQMRNSLPAWVGAPVAIKRTERSIVEVGAKVREYALIIASREQVNGMIRSITEARKEAYCDPVFPKNPTKAEVYLYWTASDPIARKRALKEIEESGHMETPSPLLQVFSEKYRALFEKKPKAFEGLKKELIDFLRNMGETAIHPMTVEQFNKIDEGVWKRFAGLVDGDTFDRRRLPDPEKSVTDTGQSVLSFVSVGPDGHPELYFRRPVTGAFCKIAPGGAAIEITEKAFCTALGKSVNKWKLSPKESAGASDVAASVVQPPGSLEKKDPIEEEEPALPIR